MRTDVKHRDSKGDAMQAVCAFRAAKIQVRRICLCVAVTAAVCAAGRVCEAQCINGGAGSMGTGAIGTGALGTGALGNALGGPLLNSGNGFAAATNAMQFQNSVMTMQYMQALQMQQVALAEELAELRTQRQQASSKNESRSGDALASVADKTSTAEKAAADERKNRVAQVQQRRQERLERLRQRKAERLARLQK
jgi:hypothetical protein